MSRERLYEIYIEKYAFEFFIQREFAFNYRVLVTTLCSQDASELIKTVKFIYGNVKLNKSWSHKDNRIPMFYSNGSILVL